MFGPASLFERLHALVWDQSLDDQPFWQRTILLAARIGWAVVRELLAGALSLRAMSLVYTTLLALVPALAIAFAIFRAFGFDSYLETIMADFLSPLGDQGAEITDRMMEFVQRVNVNVLGTVGFAFLLYTVISLINKVEAAFNSIWHVEASRSFARQFTEIVSMGILGPLIVLTVIGIMAGAISNSFVSEVAEYWLVVYLVEQSSKLLPFAVLIAAFTFIYMMVPNTRVKLDAALVGAVVAGVTWGAAGWTFATFVVKSAQYVAIYSAFASLVFFMIWLYAAWLILLGGCAIAFYYQNRSYLSAQSGINPLTLRQLDRMAVQALLLIHDAFERAHTPWTEEALARRLHVPMEAMGEIAGALCNAGFVTFSSGNPSRFVPTRPADKTRIADVMAAVRAQRYKRQVDDATLAHEPRVDGFFDALSAREAALAEPTTIATLLSEAEPVPASGSAGSAQR
ncbi:YihY/virulence factor BrkB family protein [uncultured Parvibaculum sp.]|uniref:YihY/virulence factor BrkB family protein n=1 Tax=uncultured Parvibaculum sp. TaxID=291828 RepID=UPI0030EB6B56|tara:strand:- start:15596 stop:16963 length:1368 start_codon:yes stop_codon:yes gene_type:complete